MMRVPIGLFFCVVGLFARAQYFEGKVIYRNVVTSKTPGLSDSVLSAMIGNEETYFIKGGFYESLTNGAGFSMQLYDHRNNRMYFKKPDVDTLYWLDAVKSIPASCRNSVVRLLKPHLGQ